MSPIGWWAILSLSMNAFRHTISYRADITIFDILPTAILCSVKTALLRSNEHLLPIIHGILMLDFMDFVQITPSATVP